MKAAVKGMRKKEIANGHDVCNVPQAKQAPCVNPLNPELNPICYLLALLAHHFLHVSRIRVK